MQHSFADNLDWCRALAHEAIVELLEVERCSLLFHQVIAQFHNLELAQSVVEISGVGRTAFSLD